MHVANVFFIIEDQETLGKSMSRKIGRNDPCPCGSGRKYKRCCLRRGLVPKNGPSMEDPLLDRLTLTRTAEWLKDNPDILDGLSANMKEIMPRTDFKGHIDQLWDFEKVGRMPTGDILLKLASLGIIVDPGKFADLARGYVSAIQLAEDKFYPQTTVQGYDEDFPWLAAYELWKRLLPGRPCIEMLDGFEVIDGGRIEAGRLSE